MNSKRFVFFFFSEVIHVSVFYPIEQRSPTFLVPGTGFTEHNFPTNAGGIVGNGFGRTQAYDMYCAYCF